MQGAHVFAMCMRVSVREKEGIHALLTKAMEFELPALPNAPNIGLIITYKIVFPSLVEVVPRRQVVNYSLEFSQSNSPIVKLAYMYSALSTL